MTAHHPLTDEMILDAMASIYRWKPEYRAGADAAFCPRLEMRAAADWQLEQVVDWVSKFGWYLFEHPCQKHEFISELKKAMRPNNKQEDN